MIKLVCLRVKHVRFWVHADAAACGCRKKWFTDRQGQAPSGRGISLVSLRKNADFRYFSRAVKRGRK